MMTITKNPLFVLLNEKGQRSNILFTVIMFCLSIKYDWEFDFSDLWLRFGYYSELEVNFRNMKLEKHWLN